MDKLLFLVFGTLDILVVLSLIFKIFRWPFFSYFKECLLIAFACSIESFVMRTLLHLPEWDMVGQNLILLLSLRYIIKVNFYHSLALSVIGPLVYTEAVIILFKVLDFLGILSNDVVAQTTGLDIFMLQFAGESTGALISFLIYKFNLGFSYVSVPPHERSRKLSAREKMMLTINFIAVILLTSYMFWVINFGGPGFNVVIIGLLTLGALLYLAYKEEYRL